MIKVENLSRNYGDFAAVKQVSFELQPGQIVGLLGHNGAGKTTIMKMLTGYLEPSEGQILVDGKPLEQDTQTARALMGYLPENSPLYPEMMVADYLDYCAQLRGVAADQRGNAVKKAIEATALTEKALAPINTLSRGYKQRVGVAQAIINRPKILILDEPTNGLDPSQIQHMRELIRAMGKESLVLLSTHILQEVNAICDRVLVIRHGELALDSTLNALQQSNRIVLQTNKPAADISAAMSGLPQLSLSESTEIEKGWQHHITLTDEKGDLALNTADLARSLVQKNILIYALQPESRDLETVFAQINQSTEVAHAA
jgi:ABC-2 type transport system ATP-binding protein